MEFPALCHVAICHVPALDGIHHESDTQPRLTWTVEHLVLLPLSISSCARADRHSSGTRDSSSFSSSFSLVLPKSTHAMDSSATCYTIIHDDLLDAPSSQDLRNALQKGSDEVKLDTMRRIIVGTLNGQGHVGRERAFTDNSRHSSCRLSSMSCPRATSRSRSCCTFTGSE